MAGEYVEKPADVFDYDTDWKQVALDNQPGGGNFTTEAQEDTAEKPKLTAAYERRAREMSGGRAA